MNIFGELRIGSVPNHTGYIITIDPTTKRISYRTNAQIIADLGLSDAGVQVIQRNGLAIPNISGVVNIPLFDTTGAGLVPARVGSTQTRFLREDGTWVIPTNTTYTAMTLAELNTGTVTTARVISSKTLNDWLNAKDYLTEVDLNGLLYNPTYNSTTHTFTMSIKGGGTFTIDFPIEQLISNIYLDSNNNLVLVFEDGSTTSVPLNSLLVGVVKEVNGKSPNSLGQVTINIADIPNLQTELNGKVSITTQIIAGNGLTGGGALSANRTITLGTPSSITLASTNSVTTTSHTHEFAPGGTASQYIDGTGALRAFPSIPTYSAGNGLTLTGTVFSLPVTINGTGNYVTAVVQNANGITVTKDTLPVYYNMPLLELNDGTEVTGRIISAKTLNDWINGKNFVTADALNGFATQAWVNSNFSPLNHTHSTDQITYVGGYVLGTNTPVANGQTLNEALGNIQAQINAKTNNTGTVTSVGASVAGNALNVAGTPITSTGTFAFTWGGSSAQYVNGLGNLVAFPTIPTYTAGTLAILNTGTSTTAQLWSASVLNDWLNGKNYLTSADLNGYATQSWVLSQGYVTTDTVTRVGTTAGNVTSGDILIVGGGSNTVSKTGNTITVTGTNTTYSAGNGLTLTGTTFGQTITTSGSGTFVSGITQTANGFQITLGTPPNTVYSTDTLAILNTGTSTTGALQSAKNLNDWLNAKGFSTQTLSAGTGISIVGSVINNTAPNITQVLSISGQTLSLSNGGGSVSIPISPDTITRLRGTTSGTYVSGDLTLLAGANTTITQSGSNFTIASANTTYTAGTGLALTGTVFSNTSPNITQVLGLSGNTLSLSNGGGSVIIPTAPTNYISTDYLSSRITASSSTLAIGSDFYYSSSSDASRPSGSTDGALMHQGYSSAWFTQMYSDWRTNEWYVRTSNQGTVGNWAKLWHNGNLTSVSQLINDAGYITSSSLPTVNNGQLSMSTGTGLTGSATFTANQSGNSSFSVGIASGYVLPTTAQVNTWNSHTSNTGTVTSVGLTIGGNALNTNLATITTSGTFGVTWAGNANQYVNGAGNLATFPTIPTYTAGSGIGISGTTISNTAPNVVQVLGLSGTTLSLSNGGGSVTLPSSPTYTAGANISISGSNVISATNTTYSAGNGLTLTGTSFSLPLTFSGSGTFVSNIEVTANGLTVTRSTPPNTITNIGVNNGNYSSGNINFVGGGTTTVSKSGNTVTISSSGGGSSIAYAREYKFDDPGNEDYTGMGIASSNNYYGLDIVFFNPDDGKWNNIFGNSGSGNNGSIATIVRSPFTQVAVYNPATGNEVVRGTVDLSSFGLNADQYIDEGQFHLCLMYQRTGGSQLRGSIRLVSMGEIISWKGSGKPEMFYGVYGIGYLTRFGTMVVSPMHY